MAVLQAVFAGLLVFGIVVNLTSAQSPNYTPYSRPIPYQNSGGSCGPDQVICGNSGGCCPQRIYLSSETGVSPVDGVYHKRTMDIPESSSLYLISTIGQDFYNPELPKIPKGGGLLGSLSLTDVGGTVADVLGAGVGAVSDLWGNALKGVPLK